MFKQLSGPNLLAGLILAAATLGVTTVGAQDFKVDVSQRAHRFDVNSWLRAKEIPSGQEAVFDNYFKRYALLELVAGKQNDLPKARENIGRYFQTGKSGEPYDRLTRITSERMLEMVSAQARLPELVKVNAMLVLGDLNLEENDPRNPTPLATMLPTLAKTAVNSNELDSLRVAALVGVQRHVAAGKMSSSHKAGVTQLMLPLVTQAAPAPKRSPEGHAWIRASAARILGTLGDPGQNGAVVAALSAAAAEKSAPHFMRCHMAHALGDINYPAKSQIDYAQLAGTLGWLAHDTVQADCERAKALGASEDLPDRVRLMNRVHAALTGFEGPQGKSGILKAAAAPPAKASVAAIHANVRALYATILDTKSNGEDLYKAVMPKLNALEKSLPPRGSSPAPAPKSDVAKQAAPEAAIRGARAAAPAVQETR